MMTRRYRPISVEVAAPITLGNAVTVSDANVVRATNSAASTAYLVTLVDENDVTIGTMTVLGSETVLIDKQKTWKLFAGNAAIKLVSVSYPA
jgi:uncharacterized membrane protein